MFSVTLIAFVGLVIVMLLAEVFWKILRSRKPSQGFDAEGTSGQSGGASGSSDPSASLSSDAGHSHTHHHTPDFGGHHGGFDGGGHGGH